MKLTEKAAYLKGLADGLELDKTASGICLQCSSLPTTQLNK